MENELYHHGILGMKWGVRRYQNKDGTLTSKGKKHVKAQSKSVKDMSDDELRKKVNRLQMEKQYSDLNNDSTSKGKKWIKRILIGSAGAAIGELSKSCMKAGAQSVIRALKASEIAKNGGIGIGV